MDISVHRLLRPTESQKRFSLVRNGKISLLGCGMSLPTISEIEQP